MTGTAPGPDHQDAGRRPAVAIDRERCMGSGSCMFHAPETFDVDDDMKAVLLDGGDDAPAAIQAAIEGCPSRALSLVDT